MLSLAEISDRLEIQQLLVDYSAAIDQRRFDDLDKVFTPDAYIEHSAVERHLLATGGCLRCHAVETRGHQREKADPKVGLFLLVSAPHPAASVSGSLTASAILHVG
jgi:hypothetical protein